MRLERIKIQGFKSIRELDLPLNPLNVLIGANGAGKSNFIGVFKLLNEIVNVNLQLYVGRAGGADQLLYFGRQTTDRIEIEVWFTVNKNLANGYGCTLVPAAGDRLIFEHESTYFHDRSEHDRPYEETLGVGHQESRLREMAQHQKEIPKHVLTAMQSWTLSHLPAPRDAANVKAPGAIHDHRPLHNDASHLASYLYLLREKERRYYQNLVDTIRMVAPFVEDFDLRPSPLNPNKIKLEWRERGTDAYFDANAMSDGTLRFICLATLLLQPPDRLPSIILLDEPELGLHPYAITILANLLRSAAEQTQVIVATQSVTLVNQFEPDEVIVVDRKDGQSVFAHLGAAEIDTWLDEYGLGDLWEKNVFGGRPSP